MYVSGLRCVELHLSICMVVGVPASLREPSRLCGSVMHDGGKII